MREEMRCLLVLDDVVLNDDAGDGHARVDRALEERRRQPNRTFVLSSGRTMEIPWPPMQVLPWKMMLLPLLMARQSSWLWMVLHKAFVSVGMRAPQERSSSPVLDGEVGRAAVEAVGVVARRLAFALRVCSVSRGW